MDTETKPKIDAKKVIITILLVLLTSTAVGGGVYYVLSTNFQKERDANEKALADIQKQVKELQDVTQKDSAASEQAAKDETSVRKLVTDFEAAYKSAYLGSGGASRESLLTNLFSYFTDPTGDDADWKSHLIYGKGLDNTPGGPVLFSTGGTDKYTLSFVIDSVTKTSEGFVVKVSETKKGYFNGDNPPGYKDYEAQSNFDVVKVKNNWLIDKYYTNTTHTKYVGFQGY